MKKMLLLLILLGTTYFMYSQNNPDQGKNKFYGGVAFCYFGANSDLSDYSSSYNIDHQVFGQNDLPEDEITQFNNDVRSSQTWMAPSLVFGMNLINRPGSRWALKGEAILGYLFHQHDEVVRSSGVTLLEVKNDGRVNLTGSLALALKYKTGKWHVALNPVITAGVTHSAHVSYNYLPEGSYDTHYDIRSSIYYPKVNLSGGYSFGKVCVYAGAGFGAYFNKQKLEITKSTEIQTFGDDIKADFKGKSNINAIVGFDWLFAEKFLWEVKSEAGIGFLVTTSLVILF